MNEDGLAQLRRELSVALDGVTKLAEGLTKTIKRVNTLFENDKNLELRIDCSRGETVILGKVVADMLARECLRDRNPAARLEALLKRYFLAADLFTPDPDGDSINAELAELGLYTHKLTPEERQESAWSAAVATSYRDIANALRDEAMKTITAAQRR